MDCFSQLVLATRMCVFIRLANSGFGHSGTTSPPFLPFPLPSLLPVPGRPHPLYQLGGLGRAVSSSIGVWGKATDDKRFGAYLSQKEHLWWQQFLCIFIRINFCTITRLLSSRYSVSLRAKHSVGSRGKAPGQRVSRGDKVLPKLSMLMTFCILMHRFVKQVSHNCFVFLAVLLNFVMAFIYCQK